VAKNREIYCTVSNCRYWEAGNQCKADKILVTSDNTAGQAPEAVDAPRASTLEATPTSSCTATCCKTFVARDSGDERAGDVYQL